MFKLIRSGFVFGTGTAFGVYLAQNYRMPDIAAVVSALTKKANNAAEDHKK